DLTGPYARRSVHDGGMDAVEVDRVWMRPGVDETDPQEISLPRAEGRARHAAVVRPGRVPDPGNDLDVLVRRHDLPLTQSPAAGELARLAPVEVAEDHRRVESVHLRVDRRRGHAAVLMACVRR